MTSEIKPQTTKHIPVLLNESIDMLNIQSGDTIIDGTFGGGGHSLEMVTRYPSITLVSVDLDEAAEARFNEIFNTYKNVQFVHSNYKDASNILSCTHLQTVDRVLLDLGTSSFQLDQDTRGFSFQKDTHLQMTFSEKGSHTGFDAYDIVNSWDEENIADILFYYGEEKKARVIAKAIVFARKQKEIKTTQDLVTIVLTVIKKKSKINPATKTFQALRIAVNDEYKVIQEALDAWYEKLKPGGRIAVITFHSGEDRIVKHWMKAHERVITKKPIAPSREELAVNPRSRSAKLRVIEKI